MPAHLPIVFGLGLSVGIAALVYHNRDKIKALIELKAKEIEMELKLINDEWKAMTDEATERPASGNPVGVTTGRDTGRTSGIDSGMESEMDSEWESSTRTASSTDLRQRLQEDQQFFSYIDISDVGYESSNTEEVTTPTQSEVGDYLTRQIA